MTRRYDSDGDDAAAAMAARDAQRDAVGDALEAAAATLDLLSTYRLTYRHRQRLAETARAIERGLAAHRARVDRSALVVGRSNDERTTTTD